MVMPYIIGGVRMAQSVLRPTVTSVLDLAVRGDIDLQMEEMLVTRGSELAGRTVRDSGIRSRFDVIVICIKKASGTMNFNPGPETAIDAGDLLIALGKQDSMRQLQSVCSPGDPQTPKRFRS